MLKGFRVPVGDQFIMVYPNLNCSVKDMKNQDNTVKETATAKMMPALDGQQPFGCVGQHQVQSEVCLSVSWQNIDETGAAVEEDITDGGSESGGGGGGGTNPP